MGKSVQITSLYYSGSTAAMDGRNRFILFVNLIYNYNVYYRIAGNFVFIYSIAYNVIIIQ